MNTVTFLAIMAELAGTAASSVVVLWAAAALVFFVVYGPFFRGFFAARKVQDCAFDWEVFRHEVVFSGLNVVVAAIGGLGTAWLLAHGYAELSHEPTAWYVPVAQFFIYFVGFDLYFYAVHRFMHWGPAYRLVHRVHHRSSVPNPLTAFSFHPIEGLVTHHFVTLLMVVMGLHIYALVAIYAYGVSSSLLIHSGFEVFPRRWYRSRWTRWFLTPAFHDLHHESGDSNFGGFTTIWDRLLGTMCPVFHRRYDELMRKRDGAGR